MSVVRLRTLLFVQCIVAGACARDDDSTPPIVWEGEHVRVGTELDLDTWCPGTLPRLDARAGALKALFEVPDEQLVDYYLYSAASFDGVCPAGTDGCHKYGSVFAVDPLHTHELVHAVFHAYRGLPHFFAEGGASYWGFSVNRDYRGLDVRDVLDRSWSTRMTPEEYAVAAHFTSYVVDTHGAAAYLELLRGAPADQPREELEKTFERAFGVPLTAAIEDYAARWQECPTWAIQQWTYECSRPALALTSDAPTDLRLDISCADPEVVGPSVWASPGADERRIWRDITVDLQSPSQRIAVDVPESGDPGAVEFLLKRCHTDCFDVAVNSLQLQSDNEEHQWLGSTGRYVVRVSRAADDPGPVHVRFEP